MNVNRKKVRSILVLFPGSLGDLICALPAINSLAQDASDTLSLAARGESLSLASRFSFIEGSFSLEGSMFSQLFSSSALSTETRKFFSDFSEIISWYGHAHSEVVENLHVLSSGHLRSFPFFSGQKDCHAADYYRQCLGQSGSRCPSLVLPQDVQTWSREYWQQQGWSASHSILALHPGSGGKKKRWDPEGFREVAAWWRHRSNRQVLVLLGPAEAGETKLWNLVGTVASDLSLWQVAALLSRSAFYVGNDSGISHVAGATGARGVVLFGPTQPHQWRPLGGGLQVLRNASYRESLPLHEGISLAEISADQVTRRLMRYLHGE